MPTAPNGLNRDIGHNQRIGRKYLLISGELKILKINRAAVIPYHHEGRPLIINLISICNNLIIANLSAVCGNPGDGGQSFNCLILL